MVSDQLVDQQKIIVAFQQHFDKTWWTSTKISLVPKSLFFVHWHSHIKQHLISLIRKFCNKKKITLPTQSSTLPHPNLSMKKDGREMESILAVILCAPLRKWMTGPICSRITSQSWRAMPKPWTSWGLTPKGFVISFKKESENKCFIFEKKISHD